jgi:hypothetical protein
MVWIKKESAQFHYKHTNLIDEVGNYTRCFIIVYIIYLKLKYINGYFRPKKNKIVGSDRMVVGLTITYAISAYHH